MSNLNELLQSLYDERLIGFECGVCGGESVRPEALRIEFDPFEGEPHLIHERCDSDVFILHRYAARKR